MKIVKEAYDTSKIKVPVQPLQLTLNPKPQPKIKVPVQPLQQIHQVLVCIFLRGANNRMTRQD